MTGPIASMRRILKDSTALAATEFALILPVMLGLGLTGIELANRVIVTMQISQLAAHVADNASRIGDQSMLENRRIYEADIQDLLLGAEVHGGDYLDLYSHGRVILSSLEVVPGTTGDQYIHWQRCMGEKDHQSSYGKEGDGLNSELKGMGPPGEEVIAFDDNAVMFVEVAYDYQPLIGDPFGMATTIIATSSFTVREDRDLTRIYQLDPSNPAPVANCATYGGTSYSGGTGNAGSSSTTSTTSTSSGGTTTTTSGAGSSTGSTTTTSGSSTTTGGSSTSSTTTTSTSTTSGSSSTSSGSSTGSSSTSTTSTTSGGVPYDPVAAAQAAVDAAKDARDDAKDARDDAKDARDDAKDAWEDAEDDAEDAWDDAFDAYRDAFRSGRPSDFQEAARLWQEALDAQAAADAAQAAYIAADQAYEDAKDAYEDAKDAYDEAKDALKALK